MLKVFNLMTDHTKLVLFPCITLIKWYFLSRKHVQCMVTVRIENNYGQ